jgi:hypothetical protein
MKGGQAAEVTYIDHLMSTPCTLIFIGIVLRLLVYILKSLSVTQTKKEALVRQKQVSTSHY